MNDASKVYILSSTKSSTPLGVSGSLKQLFRTLGKKDEDLKPYYAAFKQVGTSHPVEVKGKKMRITCLRLKDPIAISK